MNDAPGNEDRAKRDKTPGWPPGRPSDNDPDTNGLLAATEELADTAAARLSKHAEAVAAIAAATSEGEIRKVRDLVDQASSLITANAIRLDPGIEPLPAPDILDTPQRRTAKHTRATAEATKLLVKATEQLVALTELNIRESNEAELRNTRLMRMSVAASIAAAGMAIITVIFTVTT